MKIATTVAVLVLISGAAFAQQPAQKVTAVQILQGQVGILAGQSAMQTEQIATLQEQLAAARAQIKEFEEKAAKAGNAAPK